MSGASRGAILAIGLTLGVALIAGGVVLGFVLGGGRGEEPGFRERALDYVAAFAEAASEWLSEGDEETLRDAARFMLLGSTVFLELVWDGEVVIQESRGSFSPPEPVPSGEVPPEASVRAIEGKGGKLLEVIYPLEEGRGYVRSLIEIPPGTSPGPWPTVAAVVLVTFGAGAIGGSLYLSTRKPRPAREEEELIRVGGLVIDEVRKEVSLLGKPVRLSPKQYRLLLLLAREPGKVFSDREILQELWSTSRYADSKDVKQYIYLLRRRLGEVVPGAEALIATVPGFGYRLLSPEEIGLTGD